MNTNPLIYAAIRTPRAKGKSSGELYGVKPVDLVVTLLDELRRRTDLDTALVDDLVLGCVTPIGEQGGDIAKLAAQKARWHENVPGMQINRFCASGLEAVNLAAQKVASGWEDLVIAGGLESMSRVPMGSDGGEMFTAPDDEAGPPFVPQGISADLIATLDGFSRAELDCYALRSQQRAAHAQAQGRFDRSVIPVMDAEGATILAHDAYLRPGTTLEGLAQLPAAFAGLGARGYDRVALRHYPQVDAIDHVHTAGNSSGIVDGAALVMVGSEEIGARLGIKPRARVLSTALVGTEPVIMLTGPAPAAMKALAKAGMAPADIDLYEVNEAFAAVVLRFLREIALADAEHANVNGGAIALGHPLGATGAMLLGTLLDEMERADKETGLVTLCVGGGMGIATIVERV